MCFKSVKMASFNVFELFPEGDINSGIAYYIVCFCKVSSAQAYIENGKLYICLYYNSAL